MSIRRFEHRLAVSAFDGLPLAATNRRFAEYWLSLWQDDELPRRARFSPAAVRDLLPGTMILEVKPGARVGVRLSGTAINQAFGRDITGADLLELSPAAARAGRLANHSAVAEGAIGLARRRLRSQFGGEVESQEVYLPLGDVSEDGARLVLLHTDWRPSNPLPGTPNVEGVLEPVAEFRVFRLWREADASISQHA